MTIEDHVTSLEFSKHVSKLISTPCNCEWVFNTRTDTYEIFGYGAWMHVLDYKFIARAYLATELLEILPKYLKNSKGKDHYNLNISWEVDTFSIVYLSGAWCYTIDDLVTRLETQDANLANALAKMLIYLIENKLIEVPK